MSDISWLAIMLVLVYLVALGLVDLVEWVHDLLVKWFG